ncbi:MAG: hypothetical protein V1774_06040 [Candidatus Eisenbacteria bacterium]
MKHVPWWVMTALLIVAGTLAGCSGDKSTNAGDDQDDLPDGSGKYLIEGYFGGTFTPGGFGVWVGRIDPPDPPADEFAVTLNGQVVPEIPLGDADDAFYAIYSFDYEPGTIYTIVASNEAGTATCSFTGPEFPIVELTEPENDYFVPGEPLTLIWQYDRGAPEHIYINASGDDDEVLISEIVLDGTLLTYTISGGTTDGWESHEQVLVTVDAGESFFPFTGSLVYTGSGVTTVYTGDAALLVPGEAPETPVWTIAVTLGETSLPADGASQTAVNVSIVDQHLQECPDGTTVSFSCEPEGAVAFSPTSATTVYGACTTTLTSTTTAQDLTVEAQALGAGGTAELELHAAVHTITVGSGAYPTITWQAPVAMRGLFLRPLGSANSWAVAASGISGFGPPVIYGTAPAGSLQILPLHGTADALVAGSTYQLGLIDAQTDTTFYEFTR